MAAVVKAKGKSKRSQSAIDEETTENTKVSKVPPMLPKPEKKSDTVIVDIEKAANGLPNSSEDIECGEVIGIITLEDVFEELLQVILVIFVVLRNLDALVHGMG